MSHLIEQETDEKEKKKKCAHHHVAPWGLERSCQTCTFFFLSPGGETVVIQ